MSGCAYLLASPVSASSSSLPGPGCPRTASRKSLRPAGYRVPVTQSVRALRSLAIAAALVGACAPAVTDGTAGASAAPIAGSSPSAAPSQAPAPAITSPIRASTSRSPSGSSPSATRGSRVRARVGCPNRSCELLGDRNRPRGQQRVPADGRGDPGDRGTSANTAVGGAPARTQSSQSPSRARHRAGACARHHPDGRQRHPVRRCRTWRTWGRRSPTPSR